MFCQSCGAALAKGLAYCNRCGAKVGSQSLTAGGGPSHEKLAEVLYALTTTMGFTACGGFALVYFLATRLLGLGLDQNRVLVLSFFCLAAVVGISALLVSQFSRVLTAFLRTGDKGEAPTPELSGRNTAQIEAAREPASSVIDHTTRTFDPVYVEKDKR